MMEYVGNRILVVGEIFVVGTADVAMNVLQLHEQERDTVDEAHDIGAASVNRSLDPELAYGEEMVFL